MIKQLDIRRWHPDSRGKHEQDRSNSYLGSKISPAAELHRMRMGLFVLISGNLVTEIRLPLCQVWSPKLKVKTAEAVLENLIPLRTPGPV